MRHSKMFFAMCSLLTAYSTLGFSAPNDSAPTAIQVMGPSTMIDSASLSGVIAKSQSDSLLPLSKAEVTLLTAYVRNSGAAAYQNLSSDQRGVLARVVFANEALFPTDAISKFSDDQKLFFAGMSSREVSDFNAIVAKIRNGESLAPNEVSLVRAIVAKMNNFPGAFTRDLLPVTQYVSLNQGAGMFNSSDLNSLRGIALTAAGLSSADAEKLKLIASRNTTDISAGDQGVLKLFATSPVALDAFDPLAVAKLSVVINDNQSMFPSGLVSRFNTNFQKNQAVQMYIQKTNFNRTYLQNGNKSMDRNQQMNKTPNSNMENRPKMNQDGPRQTQGSRY